MKDRQLTRALREAGPESVPEGLRARLVHDIPESFSGEQQLEKPRRRRWVYAAAAVILLGGAGYLARSRSPVDHAVLSTTPLQIAMISEAFAEVTTAMMEPPAMYLQMDIRTRPHEPFDFVEPEADFTRLEIWLERPTESYPKGRMRVEKMQRKTVFDGTKTLFHMKTYANAKLYDGGRIDPTIADPARWVASLAPTDEAAVSADTVVASDGVWETRATISEKADWSVEEGLSGNHFSYFDRRTIVSWETDTKRLRNIEKFVRHDGREVLVSTIRDIDYTTGFPDSVFSLGVPDTVEMARIVDPGNPDLSDLSPEEVTRRFFGAWQNEDWDEMRLFCEFGVYIWYAKMNPITSFRVTGQRFKAMDNFPGWMVPYEIVFENGHTKRFRLALKFNREAQRWMLSGGL